MRDWKKITILSLIIIVICVPFIFREKNACVDVRTSDTDTVVVITAHNESLRQEYAAAFKEWYKKRTGRDVNVDWRYQGGGRDAARYLESIYSNNFRIYWEKELKRQWTPEVAAAFSTRSEKYIKRRGSVEHDVTNEFFKSNVSCDIDVMFGGGVYQATQQADCGDLIPCGILEEHPEMFTDDTIPATLSGNRLWDENGRWFGGSLSTFGIIYNIDAIKEDGIGIIPTTWMDIGRPEFYKKLAVVDPTKSGSILNAFMMLIQQQMQISCDKLKSERNTGQLSPEDKKIALSEGWMNGLKLIQKIVANGRYFTESSTRSVMNVSSGNCLAGIAVDFYGFSEAKHLEERSGSKRFKFVMPIGGGAPDTDPIGMFRGAPHPEVAKKFIEFVLSLDGQKILDFNVGVEGGPKKSTMRRIPILKTIYNGEYDHLRCDSTINPYQSAGSFTSHNEWTAPISNSIASIIRLAFLDSSDELSAAMGAIIKARKEVRIYDADRAYEILSDMSGLEYETIKSGFLKIEKGERLLPSLKKRNAMVARFRRQYARAKKVADGKK